MKDKKARLNISVVERIFDNMLSGKYASKIGFFIMFVLYVIASGVVSVTAHSDEMIALGQTVIPFNAFTGVFASLANICTVIMVVYYKKTGFILSIILLLLQFPFLIANIFHHNLSSIPGLFNNLLIITSVIVIRINTVKVERTNRIIREQAIKDGLTGLPNRFACMEIIENLIKYNKKFTVVSIDINGFKGINETMGYETGNDVLVELAGKWKEIAERRISENPDIIARAGGDEFLLIIRDYDSEEDIIKIISKYEALLNRCMTIDGYDMYITASFGYAEFPDDTQDLNSIFSYADLAVQEVKRENSSNHVIRFRPELLKTERILEVERMIRTALEKDTFYFNLQPQYDMSHKLRGFEVLARMKDENGNSISPSEFIPVAEKVGLIDKVDFYVFKKSSQFFGNLIRKTGAGITLSVNISVRHLMKSGFIDEIKNVIEESGIPANQLEVEITESIMIDSVEKALNCINEIKEMGIMIAIDDFGTGYSSLSYLKKFPANLLKVDKSFIDEMNSSESSKQYVASIISIGHIMNFDVITEGVEDAEQLETLKDIGCDFIQGYIWGKPLSQEEAEKLVVSACPC